MAESTSLSDVQLSPAEEILHRHGLTPDPGSSAGRAEELLLPVLQDIQDAYGYLPEPVLEWTGRQTGIPLSRMYGVITFYSQFHLSPRGRHTVKCCQGTACHVKGGKAVAEAISDHLEISDGETTEDGRFTYETVQCLGTCFLAPAVMVNDDYHGDMGRDDVKKILKRYK